jgi:superfamily II DNA or RNA helicase
MKDNSHPSYEEQVKCSTRLGFSAHKYMEYCMDKGKRSFMKVLMTILNITLKHEEKTAILVGKIEIANQLKKILEDLYHISVGNFTSFIEDHDEKLKELNNKIIVSTSKSLGVGTDVPELRFLIMCEPYSSDIMATQIPGRLRKQENPVMYFEMVDIGFTKIKNQYRNRRDELRKKAEKFMEIDCEDI